MSNKRKGLFMKCCVVYIFAFLTYFTLRVLKIVENGGSEPSTLITAIFAFCGFEGGVLGWIKSAKEKNYTSLLGQIEKLKNIIETLKKEGDKNELDN